jgi:hypothetical protein
VTPTADINGLGYRRTMETKYPKVPRPEKAIIDLASDDIRTVRRTTTQPPLPVSHSHLTDWRDGTGLGVLDRTPGGP